MESRAKSGACGKETRRVLECPELAINATAVRVTVFLRARSERACQFRNVALRPHRGIRGARGAAASR